MSSDSPTQPATAGTSTPQSPKRVFITGANRGIGYELARAYIASGDTVWGSGRPGRTDQLRGLEPAGVIEMDLADEAAIVGAMSQLATGTGTGTGTGTVQSDSASGLDLLINCAGIDARAVGAQADKRGPFEVNAEQFTAVTHLNATAPMVVMREALPLLRAGQGPMVVNVSSQLGSMEVAATLGNDTAYCVSKAALNMLSVKAAAALKPEGIGVVMIHPGWVSTDMGGPSAALTPEQSATAMHRTIAGLTLADTGRFIRWDGTEHPW